MATRLQKVRALLRDMIDKATGHPDRAKREREALQTLKKPVPPKPKRPAPKPYARTTRDGKTLDQITNYALYAMERRLGYTPGSLTVVQGSYNKGGVGASAGTHDGGGAVDLTPVEWPAKVHAARMVGFAAWHRPAIPGLWGEHIHMILIGNEKLSPAAAEQVDQYRRNLNGLADHAPDHTFHPNPIPTFHMPDHAQELP